MGSPEHFRIEMRGRSRANQTKTFLSSGGIGTRQNTFTLKCAGEAAQIERKRSYGGTPERFRVEMRGRSRANQTKTFLRSGEIGARRNTFALKSAGEAVQIKRKRSYGGTAGTLSR